MNEQKYLQIHWDNGDYETTKLTWERFIVAHYLQEKGSLVYFIITSNNSDMSNFDLKENEKKLILKALEETNWHQSNAAKLLKISPRVLNYKLDYYEINHPNWRKKR